MKLLTKAADGRLFLIPEDEAKRFVVDQAEAQELYSIVERARANVAATGVSVDENAALVPQLAILMQTEYD